MASKPNARNRRTFLIEPLISSQSFGGTEGTYSTLFCMSKQPGKEGHFLDRLLLEFLAT
jgi:hypothetical protein